MRVSWNILVLLIFYTSLGHALSFIHDITKRQVSRCKQGFFRCKNGECISQFNVCDGGVDCSDRSDETQGLCSTISLSCPPFSFRCAYGACVDKRSKCDGKQDCADNSDEAHSDCKKGSPSKNQTTCNSNEFECTSGECINSFSVCDGAKDCQDGSDETITQCITLKCQAFTFQCAYGACIDRNKKCDSVKDCHDGSDEAEELCKTIKPKPDPKPVTPKPSTVDSDICMLPNNPEGGKFVVKACRAVDVPHNPECRSAPTGPYTTLSFSCNSGYHLRGTANILCNNGDWGEFPLCERLCKPIKSYSLSSQCFYNNMQIPCSEPLKPSTAVIVDCRHSYTPIIASGSKTATCKSNGELSEELIQCVPECGIENPDVAQPLISLGVKSKFGEFPWHVGLYYRPNGEQICGGTLITPNSVLTAAHCVYDENNRKAKEANLFLVAAGKYKRKLEPREDYQQVLEVRDIVLKTRYEGQTTAYEQDIALLDVKLHFNLSNFILPACLDQTVTVIPPGTNGTVVGWGLTENQKPSEDLLVAHLPIVEHDVCRKQLPENFIRFITADKFCVGHMTGPGVQRGDSGGGLTFKSGNRHFVYGVVSVKPKELTTSYALFTNVSINIDWILKSLVAFKPYH